MVKRTYKFIYNIQIILEINEDHKNHCYHNNGFILKIKAS